MNVCIHISLTVSGTLNIPLDIYAVAEDGSETYIDTLSRTKRSIENIDSQAWAQVQEQVAKVQSGEIEDTQAVAATRKYKGIRIKPACWSETHANHRFCFAIPDSSLRSL